MSSAVLALIVTAANAGPPYSIESTLGDLLDNSQAHAVLEKYLPDVVLKTIGDELSKIQQ
jgi:hypothetical protein